MSGTTTTTNCNPKEGEVWLARFPYEEDNTQYKHRPVAIVYSIEKGEEEFEITELEEDSYLATKITSHGVRDDDYYDTIIVKWKEANLVKESVARVSKTTLLPRSNFIKKIGDMEESDFINIVTKYSELIQK